MSGQVYLTVDVALLSFLCIIFLAKEQELFSHSAYGTVNLTVWFVCVSHPTLSLSRCSVLLVDVQILSSAFFYLYASGLHIAVFALFYPSYERVYVYAIARCTI